MKKYLLFVFILLLCITSCKGKKTNDSIVINYHINDNVVTMTYDDSNNDLYQPEKLNGYTFSCWNDENGVVVNSLPNESKDLYAVFTKNKYTITLHNGSTITETSVDYNTQYTLPNVDVDSGYEFKGWNTKADGSGEFVTTYTIVDNVEFYAVIEEYDLISEAIASFTIPTEVSEDIELPISYKEVNITWRSNTPAIIDKTGKVVQSETNINVILYATFSFNNESRIIKYNVKVLKLSDIEILNNRLKNYEFNSNITNGKVNLETSFSTNQTKINVKWNSSDPTLIDDDGNVITYPLNDTNVIFTLTLELNETIVTKEYTVTLKAVSFEELVNEAIVDAHIDPIISGKEIYLPTSFRYNIKGVWKSSNEAIVTSDGNVVGGNDYEYITFKLTLTLGDKQMEKDIKFLLLNNKENLVIDRAPFFNESQMDGVHKDGKYLVLDDDKLSGTYTSNEFEMKSFTDLVPTWDALTSTTATVLFSLQVCVNGTWSKYFTYSKAGWGLGLNNGCTNQSDSVAKLDEDTIMILNSQSANKARYQVKLERTDLNLESPKLNLVALASTLVSSSKTFDLSKLPNNVLYNVPKLYQREVPSIGGSICSPTSCTMLLKYKGLDFSSKDTYEHRYIANLAYDHGNKIYGNWTYCCVTMGAFGVNAYFARLSGVEELAYHLAYVGPCAISVRGTMISNAANYYTAGHLLVLKGYTYNDGVLTFIANDPNVQGVECTYSKDVITDVWRKAIYVVE